MKDTIKSFDTYAEEYDNWFETNKFAYHSELEAVKRIIPVRGIGIDIGGGTGRFSAPFSIPIGIEPSKSMAKIAESKGITVHNTTAESMPFCNEYFDFALLITTLCFLDKPLEAIKEIRRILKLNGQLITGIIDKNSELGRVYNTKKNENKFYKNAEFYSVVEVIHLLKEGGLIVDKIYQTIFSNPETMSSPDPVIEGYGKGAFVVINSIKSS